MKNTTKIKNKQYKDTENPADSNNIIQIENGKITIRTPKVIAKKGTKITQAAADMMNKLDIRPFSIGIIPIAAFDNETKQFYPNLLSEVEKREQMPEREIKNYAMDWLTKYKKMPPEQAEMYYKTLEENAKKRYEENYQKFKEDSKINMLKIMKGELGGVTGDKF